MPDTPDHDAIAACAARLSPRVRAMPIAERISRLLLRPDADPRPLRALLAHRLAACTTDAEQRDARWAIRLAWLVPEHRGAIGYDWTPGDAEWTPRYRA